MIQRRQSLYLLGAVIIGSLYFFLPAVTFEGRTGELILLPLGLFRPDGLKLALNTNPLLSLTGFSIILPLAAIFMYRNRRNQMKVCMLNYLINAAIIVTFVLLTNAAKDLNEILPGGRMHYTLGLFLPVLAILLTGFAHHSIRKDEEAVKSLDRLR